MMTMATPKLSLCLVAAAAAMISLPATAGAQPRRDVRTVVVQYSDLDLSHAAGQKALESRIERAVRKVCRSNIAHNMAERQDVAQCEKIARTVAQAQVEVRIAQQSELSKQLARTRRVATDN
jgi:UrcA family protein